MANPVWEDTSPVSVEPSIGPSWDETVDLQQKYGGATGMAKAAGLGALRGASLSLSDPLLTSTGAMSPEDIKGYKEANPWTSGLSEAGGFLAPLLGTGGMSAAGLLGRAGAGVTEKALASGVGRVGAKALGYGAEGAIMGATNSISESALGDQDLVSEKTLANIGISTALSAGLGSLVGKFAKDKSGLLIDKSSAADKMAAMNMAKNALPGSEEALVSQTVLPAESKLFLKNIISQPKANAGELRKEFTENGLPIVEGMLSENKLAQRTASALAQSGTIAGDQVQAKVDEGFKMVDHIVQSTFGTGNGLTRAEGGALIKDQIKTAADKIYEPIAKQLEANKALGKTLPLVDDDLIKASNELTKIGENWGAKGSKGGKIIQQYADRILEQPTLEKLGELISEVKADQRAALNKLAPDTNTGHALGKVIGVLEDMRGEQLTKHGLEGVREAEKEYKKFAGMLGDLVQDQGLRGSRSRGAMENAFEKIADEKFLDKIFDAKNAKGLERFSKNFPDAFQEMVGQKKSQMLQDAMNNKSFSPYQLLKNIDNEAKMSSGVKNLLFPKEEINRLDVARRWMDNLPEKVGPSGTPFGEQMIKRVRGLFDPVELARQSFAELGAVATKKTLNYVEGHPDSIAIQTLSNLDKAASKTSSAISSGVKSILSKTPLEAPLIKGASKIKSDEDYKKKAKEIKDQSNNQIYLQQKLEKAASGLFSYAPSITGAMQLSMVKAAHFLNSKLPLEPSPGLLNKPHDPSSHEISLFKRYYDVVENPLIALHQVNSGTLGPETIETLNAVYPRLYQEMKQQMVDGLTSIKNPSDIPYSKKMTISMFLGEPLDESLVPANVLMTQMAFKSAQMQQNAEQQGINPTAGGLGKVSLANRTEIGHREES